MTNLYDKTASRMELNKPTTKVNDSNIGTSMFLKEALKKDTYTENGALTNSTTGSDFADDFSASGVYRNREMDEVFNTMNTLWSNNPKLAVASIFYLRMITRKTKGFLELDMIQRGQGNKDESLKRLLWLAYNKPDVFYKNLWLLPTAGTWKDLFTLLSIDYEQVINKKTVFELIAKGLSDEYNTNLVRKFLPSIKSTSKLKTVRAKILNQLAHDLRKFLGLTEKEYRNLKREGMAHTFQQKISKGLYDEIDFNRISGKALSLLTKGNFLRNNNMESKYIDWLREKPTVNFNGYAYELKKNYDSNHSLANKVTIDKQFAKLIEVAGEDRPMTGNILPLLDTSSSMTWYSLDSKGTTPLDVCLAMGVYFSKLNKGTFKNHVCMFSDVSKILKLSNDSFTDNMNEIRNQSTAWGGTNFQSTIDLIVKLRKERPEIPVEDFPKTLLVITDNEFNPSGRRNETNHEVAIKKLEEVGLYGTQFIWWRVNEPKRANQPSTIDDIGTYVMSGFDGATVSLILGGEEEIDKATGKPIVKTMDEKIEEAYSQELLTQIKL